MTETAACGKDWQGFLMIQGSWPKMAVIQQDGYLLVIDHDGWWLVGGHRYVCQNNEISAPKISNIFKQWLREVPCDWDVCTERYCWLLKDSHVGLSHLQIANWSVDLNFDSWLLPFGEVNSDFSPKRRVIFHLQVPSCLTWGTCGCSTQKVIPWS